MGRFCQLMCVEIHATTIDESRVQMVQDEQS